MGDTVPALRVLTVQGRSHSGAEERVWALQFDKLALSFLICKVGIIILTLQSGLEIQ